jgi:hypothetical protein
MTDLLSHDKAIEYVRLRFRKNTLFRKKVLVVAVPLDDDTKIETREGWLEAKKGDYLVTNEMQIGSLDGWPWPVKKEIFEKTYEPVKD